ncbi:MAG: prepilin-type N-terminal cleavage/methylation domain-containing protein [Desulfobacterales bacterium]|nr:prepilin-type N-terminal cleavage/methylation domain-containing protein [Desulfobacterales bacterium]
MSVNRPFSPDTGQAGFTMLELIVAFAVATLFLMATLFIVDACLHSYRAQERIAGAQQDVRAGLDFMVRDIRMAGFDPLGNSDAGILTDEAGTIEFTMDISMDDDDDDDDNIDPGSREHITYAYDAANNRILRSYPKPGGGTQSDTLIENVSALSFDYIYYRNNEVVANGDPDEIKAVIITMTCRDRDSQGGVFERTLTTTVKLRNL